ncbi:hypothetical protein ACFO5Q_01000 [Kordiimonas lipolytica]|uniref:Outer membrane protein beta-barrel domain-containing protein n=1 Tax=Kordiimonas lipolytica TaxID=1662421 RepID=A0ABV8U6U4_9PROT|nr:hypothetical protein [Kordiimonas lipolytica]
MKSKKKVMIATAACALWTGPAVAADEATIFSYSFFEGAFVHDDLRTGGLQITDRDGVGDTTDDNFGTLSGDTGNGASARLSFELFGDGDRGFHIVTDYIQTSHAPVLNLTSLQGWSASGVLDAKQKEWRAAIGYHTLVGQKVSLFAEVGVVNSKVDFGTAALVLGGSTASADLGEASGSRTSVDAKLGVRAMVSERFEVTGFARYHGNGDIGTSDGGNRVDFSGKVRAGAGVLYRLNKRFAFGLDYEFGKPGRARLGARLSF